MNIAKLLETIFLPSNVIVATMLVLLYFNMNQLTMVSIFVYGLVVVGLPIAFHIMKRRTRRKNRAGLIGILISLIVFYILSVLFPNIREVFYPFFGSLTFQILGIIVFSIRHRWKISLHTSVLTDCITVLALIDYRFVLLTFLIPLVAWSRVKLKEHTTMQVIAGFILGLLIPILTLVNFII